MKDLTLGYAMCGSFCTLKQSIAELKKVKETGANIIPIMSTITYTTDTRFGKAEDFRREVEEICQNSIIKTIAEAEPIGPKALLDALIIAPCTGNTIAKLANGVTDTPVTMATKAHLRNGRPVVINVATNDALSASSKNIGLLLNTKNIYFVPMRQDAAIKKPTSIVADFGMIIPTLEYALEGIQIQPILI